MPSIRAAIYIRVSTEEQAKEGFSLGAQRDRCEEFARSQGWEIVGVYTDDGYSAKNLKRPSLQRLMQDAEARAFDAVLVWKVDRLSRRQRDTLHLIEDVFTPAEVGFRSVTESFDTTSPAGMAMLGMLAVFAQLERATIVERTVMGRSRRLSEGRWVGTAPFGYRYAEGGHIEPDAATAPWVERIYRWAIDGMGLQTIARRLERDGCPAPFGRAVWYYSTVSIILRSRVYLGERREGREWAPFGHEPLISEGLWLRAQQAVRSRQSENLRPRKDAPSPFLLTGLLFCGGCGRRMSKHTSGGREYYVCYGQKHGKPCSGYHRIEKVDEQVVSLLFAAKVEAPAPPVDDAEAARLRERIADIDARIARLVEAIEAGAVPVAQAKLRADALRVEREDAQDALAQAETSSDAAERHAASADVIRALHEAWPSLTLQRRQEAARTLIAKVVLTRGEVPRVYPR